MRSRKSKLVAYAFVVLTGAGAIAMAQEREQTRARVGAVALRLFHNHGRDISVQIYKGTIDAMLINLMAHIGRDAAWDHVLEIFGEVKPSRSKPTLIISNDRGAA